MKTLQEQIKWIDEMLYKVRGKWSKAKTPLEVKSCEETMEALNEINLSLKELKSIKSQTRLEL